jgi:putative ABC transport system permease protein
VIAGRAFRATDAIGSTPVAIVNQTAAAKFWPNEDPVGTRIVSGRPGFTTVVGVVADVRQQLDRPPAAEIYVPLQQVPIRGTTWVIRTERPVSGIESAVRAAARAHDAELPVTSFRTLDEVRATTLAPRRVVVALIGLFGLLALVITAAGIAGVVAFSVNQRTHEFGIRMALGAQRARVLSLVIREGVVMVIVGLGIGLAGAGALTRVLGRMLVTSNPQANGPLLFDVQPTDALTYAGVALVLLLVALVACLMPARRAASVDPMIALRAQ